ncbi:MAG: DUF1593 domain-containing protein [Akkermansiaceae bacterium]|nr:DUF1593 domain-containing protein [Akkermansiaceae bacterium]
MADMGNEPDEVQQIFHLLMCSNELEIEGLIAVTGIYLRPDHKEPYRRKLYPELFIELINGYASVYPNLKLHADGWKKPEELHKVVASGQPGYGIDATGEGKASAGSKLIIDAVTKADSRPLHIVVNAGANTLAQALKDYRANHSAEELKAFLAKFECSKMAHKITRALGFAMNFPICSGCVAIFKPIATVALIIKT